MEIKISNKKIVVDNNETTIEELKKPKPKPKPKPKLKKTKKGNSIKVLDSTDVWIGGKKYS